MSDISVTLVDRGRVHADKNYVVDGYAMADASNPDPDHEIVEFVVWNAVVDHPEATILWDTGSHPEAGDGYWPKPLYDAFEHVDAADHHLDDDLNAVGYSLGDIATHSSTGLNSSTCPATRPACSARRSTCRTTRRSSSLATSVTSTPTTPTKYRSVPACSGASVTGTRASRR